MKQFAFILIAALACAGCGYANRYRIDFPEIERPVTTEEIVGRWVMWTNRLDCAIAAGFKPQTNQEFAITIRRDGSGSYHSFPCNVVASPDYIQVEGQWSLRYYGPTNYNRNFLEFKHGAYGQGRAQLYVGQGKDGVMVLYGYWGDPDDGKYIVYQKEDSAVPASPSPPQTH